MNIASPPMFEPIATAEDFRAGAKLPKLVAGIEWIKWFGSLVLDVQKAPVRQASVRLTAQAASIGTTAFPLASIPPGLWRISYYARITQPASTSSSLIVTFGWMDGSVTMSYSGAAITGNLTTAAQFGTVVLRSDNTQPISYSTTYGSVGATPMQYELDMVCEELAPEET